MQPNSYNIVVANNVLFFLGSNDEVTDILKKVIASLVSGGFLLFTLLGSKDEWVEKRNLPAFSMEEIQDLLDMHDLSVYFKSIEEGWGTTMSGNMKYWHIHKWIVRKR